MTRITSHTFVRKIHKDYVLKRRAAEKEAYERKKSS
jgi:hypothetical protein